MFAGGLLVATLTFNVALYVGLKRTFVDVSVARLRPLSGPTTILGNGLFAGGSNPYGNIVHIDALYQSYKQSMPWQAIPATIQPGVGLTAGVRVSGVILERGLILTSSHAAVDAVLLTAQRQGDTRKYSVKPVVVARELDLAILNVTDPSFWKESDINIKPRLKAPFPELGSEVIVAGYPKDSELSIAHVQSRISRVKAVTAGGIPSRYNSFPNPVLDLHPQVADFVGIGPVFNVADGTLAGFATIGDFVVPERTIAAILAEAKQGVHDSPGMLGMVLRSMRAPGMRKYWGLEQNDLGVQVRSVAPDSPLQGKVAMFDVLVAVDGQPVHSSGTVPYGSAGNEATLPFQVLLGAKAAGESTKLHFIRPTLLEAKGHKGYETASKGFDVDVVFKSLQPLAKRALDSSGFDVPRYFMVGGFVFAVFTEQLIDAQMLGEVGIPPSTMVEAMYRWRSNKDEEVVVLLRRMDHECTKFYSTGPVRVLKYLNDQPVENLEQLVRGVGAALTKKTRFLRFAFGSMEDDDAAGGLGDPDVVLDTSLCAGADLAIGQTMGVRSPVSPDLQKLYQEVVPQEFYSPQAATTNGLMPIGQHDPAVTSPKETMLPTKEAMLPKQEKGSQPQEKPANNKASDVPQANASVNRENELSIRPQASLPWNNVVQVTLIVGEKNFLTPWRMGGQQQARCSGVIVDAEKRIILTNSHCVASTMMLFVTREDHLTPVMASVREIARDLDLAWITTEAASFWENPSKFTKIDLSATALPYLSANVNVVGFPQGGNSITITKGIVSRLDGSVYPNGLDQGARNTPDSLPIVQVDASINHGNSGGPAFDEKGGLMGLAFCSLAGASNVGYIIPALLLKNFVETVQEAGRWQAQPEVGAMFRPILNPSLRSWLRLKESDTGVQVRSISPKSPLHELVRKGDVLLRIDGLPVSGEGTITQTISGRKVAFPFDTLVTEKKGGETTAMEFLRVNTTTGAHQTFPVKAVFHPIQPLAARFDDSPMDDKGREYFTAVPDFFVFGTIVWGVFSNPVLQQALAQKMEVPWTVRKHALHQWRKGDEEVVVLMQGLSHRCNQEYDMSTMRVLRFFNGQKISNLKEFIKLAGAANKAGEDYVRFTFEPLAEVDAAGGPNDPDIVMPLTQECAKADSEVMSENSIPFPGVSSRLRQVYFESFGMPTLNGVPPQLVAALKQYMQGQPPAGASEGGSGSEEFAAGGERDGPAHAAEETSVSARTAPAKTAPGSLIDLGASADGNDAAKLRKRGAYLSNESPVSQHAAFLPKATHADGLEPAYMAPARVQDAEMRDPMPQSDAGSIWSNFVVGPSPIDAQMFDSSFVQAQPAI
jgi:S1-C subfamily serine protease